MGLASLLSVMLLAAPEAAPDADATTDEPEIIVEGDISTDDRKTIINRAIRALMRPEGADQYARFEDQVCPSAIGFPEAIEEAIEDRIRIVAEVSGAGAAPQNCRPNLHLMVVDDGAETIRMVRAERRAAFGLIQPSERDRIARGPGPVYNWHAVIPVSSEDGQPVGDYLITNVSSRILQPVTQNIQHAVVLVERHAANGMTAIQLADFAAMRGMLKVNGSSESLGDRETILRLFDAGTRPEDHPLSLTRWDLSLLQALYTVRSDLTADRQRSAMARVIAKGLAGGN